MIFLASLYPVDEKDWAEKSAANGFLLLRDLIKSKKWWRDEKLEHMYHLMQDYIFFYTESPYCYLMTDNYFYKSDFGHAKHPSFPDTEIRDYGCILGMQRLPHNYRDYAENREKYPHEYLHKDKRVFSHDDIDGVFSLFEQNNFKKNDCMCVCLL